MNYFFGYAIVAYFETICLPRKVRWSIKNELSVWITLIHNKQKLFLSFIDFVMKFSDFRRNELTWYARDLFTPWFVAWINSVKLLFIQRKKKQRRKPRKYDLNSGAFYSFFTWQLFAIIRHLFVHMLDVQIEINLQWKILCSFVVITRKPENL